MRIHGFVLLLFLFICGPLPFGQSSPEEIQACRLLEQGQPQKAAEMMERNIKRYPNNYDSRLYLGLSYMLMGDAGKAAKELHKVERDTEQASAAPAAITADRTYADTDRMGGRSGRLFSRTRRGLLKYALGMLMKQARDYKNARQRFEEAVKSGYPEGPARKQLVMINCLLKEYDRAAKEFETLSRPEPADDSQAFLAGYIAWQTGNPEIAEARFSELAEAMPPARRNLAVILYNRGEYRKALDIWLGILEQSPRDADSLKNSGRAYYHLGETDKGQAQFDTLGFKMKVEKYSPKTIPLMLIDLYPEPEFDFMCRVR